MNLKKNIMMEIDGAAGEGGGQILRTSLALAMCTGQPFELTRIRAGRAKPGLMRQHLSCVNAALAVCGGEAEGAALNAQTLRFTPGPVRAGDYTFSIGTAGSCTLVLQTVWPALLLADGPTHLTLNGGTHNPMAPCFHFLERSYAPLLQRLGAGSRLTLRRLGFYPAGGGQIEALILPADDLQPFDLVERGALEDARGECFAPGLARGVAQQQLEALGAALGWNGAQLYEAPVRQREGPGNALLATLRHANVTEVFSQFGDRTRETQDVARALVDEVRAYQGSTVVMGPYLADQWALPLALAVWQRQRAARYTCTELTPHAHTNFDVIARFLPVRFTTQAIAGGWQVEAHPA